jgi:hypothetical protein
LVLGATLPVLGLVGLFNVLQPVIDVLPMIRAVWFVAAATVLLLRSGKASADQLSQSARRSTPEAPAFAPNPRRCGARQVPAR